MEKTTKTEIVYVCTFQNTYDSCFGKCENCPSCKKEVNDEK